MVYHGTVRQGVVVLDQSPPFRDGTRVQVQLEDVSGPAAQTFHPVGAWEGPPGELEHLLSEVQELRDAD
jgi:hypothetical protein